MEINTHVDKPADVLEEMTIRLVADRIGDKEAEKLKETIVNNSKDELGRIIEHLLG